MYGKTATRAPRWVRRDVAARWALVSRDRRQSRSRRRCARQSRPDLPSRRCRLRRSSAASECRTRTRCSASPTGQPAEDEPGMPRSKVPLGRCCAAASRLRRRTQSLQAYSTFEDVERDDARRMHMLALSRDSDPIFGGGVFSNPRKPLSTVVPTLLIAHDDPLCAGLCDRRCAGAGSSPLLTTTTRARRC